MRYERNQKHDERDRENEIVKFGVVKPFSRSSLIYKMHFGCKSANALSCKDCLDRLLEMCKGEGLNGSDCYRCVLRKHIEK